MRPEIISCLMQAGLRFKESGRYITSQCPSPDHDDKNPSAQIFDDGWVNCMGPCGRFHIGRAFPSLAEPVDKPYSPPQRPPVVLQSVPNREYKQFDLFEAWKKLPLIPRDHILKTIPLEALDKLGWRLATDELGMGAGYFIPYFSADKKRIPFAQVRHLSGPRRFSFLKDAKPVMYGSWNIANTKHIYLAEGSTDGVVLELVGVPWVAAPSASSGELVTKLAEFCKKNDITVIYAGDNDKAGDKLLEALEHHVSFRIQQPPREFKDWGEMMEAGGIDQVKQFIFREHDPEPHSVRVEDIPAASKADLPEGTPEWLVEAAEDKTLKIIEMEALISKHPKINSESLQRARRVKLEKKLSPGAYVELLEAVLNLADRGQTTIEI